MLAAQPLPAGSFTGWAPVVALPPLVLAFAPAEWPRWLVMWVLSVVIFAGCKWLTWWGAPASRAPIWLHQDDRLIYAHAVEQGAMFGYELEQPPPPDRWYDLPGPIGFGDYDVFVHHTPGHCPGNVCLQVGKRGTVGMDLFVGDTLFAGSIGRTDLPGGSYEVLMRAITDVLLPFGDDARVRPGHGPDTTIGRERQTNPFLLEWAAARR